MMVSPKAAKAAGDKFGLQPVCAGPYKFVERVAQGQIVVEKFADYWDKANIHIDRVEFVPIIDATARLANLRSGDLQLIERVWPPTSGGPRRPQAQGVERARARLPGHPPQRGQRQAKGRSPDGQVRQALDLAIDRETIIKTVFNNEFMPGNQLVSPTSPTIEGSRCGNATSRRPRRC